jgi:RNA polymerase sigma factor (sigma-70 family)
LLTGEADLEPHLATHPSDDELWRAAQGGDADSFGELFERHARAIYNFCFRRTADWSSAEEMTSTVFLEAWRRRDKRIDDGMVLAWLYGVASHVSRNRSRSMRRRSSALQRLPRDVESPDFAGEADARVDDERLMRDVQARLARLRQDERDVVALCIWSELSYEEAAVALGVPVGTVRSRLSRARQRLREPEAPSGHSLDETSIEKGL